MTGGGSTGAAGPGLQAARTTLAWSRTSLGVGANAALLAARELPAGRFGVVLVPIVVALAVAVATVVVGRRRGVALRADPLPHPLASATAVPLIGWSVVVLAVLTGAALLVS